MGKEIMTVLGKPYREAKTIDRRRWTKEDEACTGCAFAGSRYLDDGPCVHAVLTAHSVFGAGCGFRDVIYIDARPA